MIVHHEIAGDGPPLVLANSLGTTLAMWDAQLPALSGRFQVVRYDHRGHGGSPAPPGPYTIEELAGDVLGLLDRLELERVGFAGISLGGMIGIWLAAYAPERIASLGLVCTSAYLGAKTWQERIDAVRAGGTAAIAGGVMERWFSPRYRDAHPDRIAEFIAELSAVDDEGYTGCCAAIADMDLRPELAKVTAPTMVMAGGDDPATPPEHGKEIAERIDGAQIVVLADTFHLAPVERPGAVNRRLLDHFRRTMDA
jgi:3-oxoadipate enol-lactonase